MCVMCASHWVNSRWGALLFIGVTLGFGAKMWEGIYDECRAHSPLAPPKCQQIVTKGLSLPAFTDFATD
jgi:hypothetical protein